MFLNEGKKLMPMYISSNQVFFPSCESTVLNIPEEAMKLFDDVYKSDRMVFLATAAENSHGYYETGTIATVRSIMRLPFRAVHVVVDGVCRARVSGIASREPYLSAELMEDADIDIEDGLTEAAFLKKARELFFIYARHIEYADYASVENASSRLRFSEFSYLIGNIMFNSIAERRNFLSERDVRKRGVKLITKLKHETDIARTQEAIMSEVREAVGENQRQFILREQLKYIQNELSGKDGKSDSEVYRARLAAANLPDYAKDKLEAEIDRLDRAHASSPESSSIRDYIEFALSLPWNNLSDDSFDLSEAERLLDEEHYGLEKIKERIVEFLAVRKKSANKNSPVLCLVGPPGVGKTSIAASIAKALNRKYYRIALGGMSDEAEIRGHRKTYIGATCGRILYALKQAGTKNPLILLDEVDKLGKNFRGDPAFALLEVLDSEQNKYFTDNYLAMSFDLSDVVFLCTANSAEELPVALYDRLEILPLSSYTQDEKRGIAEKYLVSKQLEKHGLSVKNLKLADGVIDEIITRYTREAGVRQLERLIADICRKAVKLIVSGEKKSVSVSVKNLQSYLGPKKFKKNDYIEITRKGVAKGLAWTNRGGDVLFIEANTMRGSGKLELTGNMGKVMQESAKAAISYIRSVSDELGLAEDFYKETDIHVHIPEGAVPKDGPSAGITIASAIISALSGKICRSDVAMTGEITLSGTVLPIGGLKEKLAAAKRAGVSRVIIPAENKADIAELPMQITDGIKIIPVSGMNEVIKHVMES